MLGGPRERGHRGREGTVPPLGLASVRPWPVGHLELSVDIAKADIMS